MRCDKKVFMVASSLYAAGMLSGGFAYAGGLPSGGQVVDGSASISQQGDTLNINQQSDKAIISWKDFSVGKGNTVNFNQPASDSATLNRVTGDFTSEIAGQINANGSVFLINPNGILITADGVIDTGGFVASTLDIDTNDFLNGDYTFTKSGSNGVVSNRGRISVDDGGFVALLGGAVKNSGVVRAHVGKVGFGGGEKIVMSFGNNDFLRVEVPTDKWDKLTDSQGNKVLATVDLGGTVDSRGGFIDIAVADAVDILRQSISITGVVSANTVSSTDGVISISGGSLGVIGNGRITADADYGNAGSINVNVDSIDGNGRFSAASQNGTGGKIKISLQHGADLTVGASFDVSGRTAGGSLSFIGGLSGKGESKILGSIDFKADSTDGKGGYIDIGNKGGLVGLFSGTLSATGKVQGGRIRIGGAFQGGGYDPKTSQLDTKTQDLFVTRWADNSSLVSASKTSLGTGVHVDVSSASGTGGTAILWADHTTNNYAAIDATGATSGGAVEISGKKQVKSFGLARVKAGNGVILLDPKNIRITAEWGSAASQVQQIASAWDHWRNGKFGASVALSRDGNTMAVGAPGVDLNKGAVYIYDVAGGKWGATATHSRTIKHDTRIYVESTGRMGSVHLEDNGKKHYFGSSVALNDDGKYLAVGAPSGGGASKGEVSLFHLGSIAYYSTPGKGSTLVRKRRIQYGGSHNGDRITVSGGASDPQFGSAVAISDDGKRMAVGASNELHSGCAGHSHCRGAVYVITTDSWNSNRWGNSKYLKIDNKQSAMTWVTSSAHGSSSQNRLYDNHRFGFSLAMSSDGTKLAVGDPAHRRFDTNYSYGHEKGGKQIGAVHLLGIIYKEDDDGSVTDIKPYYARLVTHSSSAADDEFGSSVALSGDGFKLAVGAPNHDSGVSGDNKYGAVYLYNIPANGWAVSISRIEGNNNHPIFERKIDVEYDSFGLFGMSSSNKLDKDHLFGSSVALNGTGDRLVVGSPGVKNNSGHVRLINVSSMKAIVEGKLNDGTNLTYYASNNITIDADITASSGKLNLIAGKSIEINNDIKVNGGLVLKANDASDSDFILSERDTGKAEITVAAGKKLETNGDLIIKMLTGASGAANNKKQTGKITVDKVKGERVSIAYAGATNADSDSEIVIRNGGQVEATKTSEVTLTLKADKFTNQSNGAALKVASGGRYLVWTTTPRDNTMGGITNYNFAEFNKAFNMGSGDWQSGVTGSGSGFIYSINPNQLLKVTVKVKTKVYDGTSDMVAVPGGNLKFKDPDAVSGLTFAVGNTPSGGHKKFFATSASFGTKSGDGKFYKTGTTSFVAANEQKDAGTNLILKYAAPTDLIYKDGNGKAVHGINTVAYEEATGASITKRTLTVGATFSNRGYNGETNVIGQKTAETIDGWVNNEGDGKGIGDVFDGSLTATAASKDAGTHIVTLGGLTGLKTAYATNYKFEYDNSKSITINKVTLTVGATYSNRDYDGTRNVRSQATVTIGGWVNNEGDGKGIGDVFNGSLTAMAASKDAGTHIVTLGGLTGLQDVYTKNYKLEYDNSKSITIDKKSLNLRIDNTNFGVNDRPYEKDKVSAPVYIKNGKNRYSGVGGEIFTLTIAEGAFIYGNDGDGDNDKNDEPIFIGDIDKFTLSSQRYNPQNYKLQYNSEDLRRNMPTTLKGNINAPDPDDNGQKDNTDLAPGGGSGGGGGGGGDSGAGVVLLGAGAVVATQTGVLAKVTAAATAAAGAAGAASGAGAAGAGAAGAGGAGGASGTLGAPLGSIDTIFNSGVYAHLSGIDMQALYQPQTPLPSIFNTPQKVTYKAKYTTTYDMTILANNIKAQKVVPLYQLDEKMYETLKRIFVHSGETDDTPHS